MKITALTLKLPKGGKMLPNSRGETFEIKQEVIIIRDEDLKTVNTSLKAQLINPLMRRCEVQSYYLSP